MVNIDIYSFQVKFSRGQSQSSASSGVPEVCIQTVEHFTRVSNMVLDKVWVFRNLEIYKS